jgi:hypothetical protein
VRAHFVTEDERALPGHPDYDPRWAENRGGRFKVGRCGRRWGKTVYGETWDCDGAAKGWPVAWFAPTYKYTAEVWNDLVTILDPIIASKNKTEGTIHTTTGGQVDLWTLEDDRAGRGRKYKRVVVDEAAFTGPNMMGVWEKAIKPTLLDMGGSALVISNTNGVADTNFMYQICHDPKYGFSSFHAPSMNNPHVPMRLEGESLASWKARQDAEYADLRRREHPLVFKQEYLAEFVDWSGVAFFGLDKLLINVELRDGEIVRGDPVPMPVRCDYVVLVMDCATKTGRANDSTAALFLAVDRFSGGNPVTVLDWDVQQIEGDLLPNWLPALLTRGEQLARECGARTGFVGAYIEDKDSGQVLLQHARRNRLPCEAIPGTLTALGKDERALSVSTYHHQGMCKISRPAYDKTVELKGSMRNHLVAQITGFRVGDPDAAKRADDCLDTYTYGLALTCGNNEGF